MRLKHKNTNTKSNHKITYFITQFLSHLPIQAWIKYKKKNRRRISHAYAPKNISSTQREERLGGVELTQFVDSNEKFGQYLGIASSPYYSSSLLIYSIQYTVYRPEFEIHGNLQRRQTTGFQAFQQVSAQRNRKKYSKKYLHYYIHMEIGENNTFIIISDIRGAYALFLKT